MAKFDARKAPNKKQEWNDKRNIVAPRQFLNCRSCGDRIFLYGGRPMNYPAWEPHKCQPKVRHFSPEEIAEINAKLKKTEGSGTI